MGIATPDYEPTASDLRMAANDIRSDDTDSTVHCLDRNYALDAYRAFDDGGLAEAPQALAAYVGHQQHTTF